jgi:uncharacterized protein (TIGR01777 family)
MRAIFSARSHQRRWRIMRFFVTGGTGFVGETLTRELAGQGHHVTILTRSSGKRGSPHERISFLRGDPTVAGEWQEEVSRSDVVINLAGASIFRRWTPEAKKMMRESRVLTTQNVVQALSESSIEPQLLVSTSAVGYYGFHRDEELDERSPAGDDFLADLAREWEEEALRAAQYGTRVVICRFGIVLGKKGGALGEMIPIFRKGLGSPLGSGSQWVSWIHEQDLADVYLFLLNHGELSGPVNCTAPHPVTNKQLTEALAHALGAPLVMPAVPGFVLKLVKGEVGSILLKGQRALPRRLIELGFDFKFSHIDEALKDLLI